MNNMNTAKLIKQTEKAIFVEFCCFLIDDTALRMKTWLPKSQLKDINELEDGKISFETKGDWLIGAKVRDYAKYLRDNGYELGQGLRELLAIGNNNDIEYCFA